MIIISQDKDAVINFDNIQLCRINQDGIVYALLNDNDSIRLGEYESEGRAQELLEDIVRRYEDCNKYNSGFVANKIYFMPKE